MQASVVAREFTFNGVRIPDPDKSLSPEEVRSVLATCIRTSPPLQSLDRKRSATNSGTTSFALSVPRGDFPMSQRRRKEAARQDRRSSVS
jgi:hypothetical protein